MKTFAVLAVLLVGLQMNLAAAETKPVPPKTCAELEKDASEAMTSAYKKVREFNRGFNTILLPWCKTLDAEKECGELRLVFDHYYNAKKGHGWDETNFKMGYVSLLDKILPHMTNENGSPYQGYEFDKMVMKLFELHYTATLETLEAGLSRAIIDQHKCE